MRRFNASVNACIAHVSVCQLMVALPKCVHSGDVNSTSGSSTELSSGSVSRAHIEPAAGIIMTFKFTFSAHVCLKFTFKIFCWMSLVCQVFENQFIVSLPPRTFLSFCGGCFSDGMTVLGKPDAGSRSQGPHFLPTPRLICQRSERFSFLHI